MSRGGPVLAGAPLLVGFAFLMGIVLTIVIPTTHEFADGPDRQPVDAYSIAYLRVLTRANPRDARLRAVYAKQLGALGQWDEALAALDAGVPDPAVADETRALRIDLMLARARAAPEGSSVRSEAFARVHAELRAASSDPVIAPSRAEGLARLALELEDPALAARLYLAIAGAEPDAGPRAEAFASAARWLRASADEGLAADLLREAARTTTDPARKLVHLVAAADALEAMDRPCAAADVLAPDADVVNDRAFVARATALATGCGRAREAKTLGRRLLAMAPGDDAATRAQVRRELAAGDPAGALELLRQLLERSPNDPRLHDTTARVAEWAGQPRLALEQWLWLLGRGYAPAASLALP